MAYSLTDKLWLLYSAKLKILSTGIYKRIRDSIVSKITSKKATSVKSKTVTKGKSKSIPKATAKKKTTAAKKTPARKSPVQKKKATAKKKVAAKKKTTAEKKTVTRKKTAVQKNIKSKVTAKKASSATKAPPKKAPAKKKPSVRKAPVQKPAPGKRKKPIPALSTRPRGKALTKRELKKFEKILLELRDRLQGDIRFLTTDNLHRAGRETGADLSGSAQHSADHGTDNFDREFALSLASTEQDVLYEVDEALMRIDEGGYGICEMTGVQIERARLEVIPYTRYSVQAQSKMEQSRAKYRPFSQTFKGW